MPAQPITHEKKVNIAIAHALKKRNPHWDAVHSEDSGLLEQKNLSPDIYIDHGRGDPIIIEGKWHSIAEADVETAAKNRIGQPLPGGGAITQAVAIRIPNDLRKVPDHARAERVESAEFHYAFYSRGHSAATRDISSLSSGAFHRFPNDGWLHGNLTEIGRAVDLCLLSEDLVKRTLDIMLSNVKTAARILKKRQPGILSGIADRLKQGDGKQTRQMAMTIVCNAMVFHEVIAGGRFEKRDGKPLDPVKPLSEMAEHPGGSISKGMLIEQWTYILDKINYWPIFDIARDIISPINNKTASLILDKLNAAAEKLSRIGITSVHDLAGRMFQQMIAARKMLATFYTLPESAALLAEIAVGRLDTDWNSIKACHELKIGDFACGTGTLLSAAYQSILAQMRAAAHDDAKIHKLMMERGIWGADVLPAATHLATSQLASAHPQVLFDDANIHALRLGHDPQDGLLLGALELINASTIQTLFGKAGKTAGGKQAGEGKRSIAFPAGKTDLVIMNPPYLKADANKRKLPYPQFAAFGADANERKEMSTRLKTFKKSAGRGSGRGKSADRGKSAGNDRAGMGSHFIDVAHHMVKPGGQVALVLSAAALRGASWRNARELLAFFYRDVLILTVIRGGGGTTATSRPIRRWANAC